MSRTYSNSRRISKLLGRVECQHVQSIALGTAYAAMKTISADKTMTKAWMTAIENCVQSAVW